MKKGLLLAFGLMVASFSAGATTIQYTYNLGTLDPNNGGLYQVTKFNPTYGTLNSVSLSFTNSFSPDGSSTTNGPTAQRIRTRFTSDYLIENYKTESTTPGGNSTWSYSSVDNGFLTTNTVDVFSSIISSSANAYAANQTRTASGFAVNGTLTDTLTSGSDLVLYTGTSGTVDFNVFYNAGFGVNGTVNATGVNVSLVALATSSLVVTYDYTVPPPSNVPEPASMALVGSALFGAGIFLRRRK